MKEGPDIARIASLIGDPARANILTALMGGKALTASELAAEAGVTLQTASSHLSKLDKGGLLRPRKQGRHKYFSLADDSVAEALEGLMGLAARSGHLRTRTGPKDEALRQARVCYNHLAGAKGVQLLSAMQSRGFIDGEGETLSLTDAGEAFVSDFGVDLPTLQSNRSPLCRECLDWSERRSHLAGSLGRALFTRFEALGWTRCDRNTRVVHFSADGAREFQETFL